MDQSEKIFELVKERQWTEATKIVKDGIDVNIRDNSNNYLIQYAVLFNNVEFAKLLIDRGSKLDMVDSDGRSLLYIPIKYNFLKMLELLLKADSNYVGISIVDFQDKKGLIPLHYAIFIQNIGAVKLLLEGRSNVNTTDKNGNNSLHLAIVKKNLEICKLVLGRSIDIDMQNVYGETALHMACNYEVPEIVSLLLKNDISVDITEYEFQLTALMYAVNLNNLEIIKMLIEAKADPMKQDIYGNNSLHYAVKEKNSPAVLELIPYFDQYHTTNFDGETVAHLALRSYNYNLQKLKDISFDQILARTNLNIQNNDGTSIFKLLTEHNLWKEFEKVLVKKSCNIYIMNNEKKRPIDDIPKKELDLFYDIVSKGYLHELRREKYRDQEWEQDWENNCRETGKDEKCLKKIRKRIMEDKVSVPTMKSTYCVNVMIDDDVEFPTYTGGQIDIIFGLLHLKNSFPKLINTSLTKEFVSNPDVDNYYNSLGIRKSYKVEFLNFEIIWVYQRLFFPTNFDETFTGSEARFFVMPLGIDLSQGSHANILIYDKEKGEIERFESFGSDYPWGFNYNPSSLDLQLKQKFERLVPGIKFISPDEFLPKIGFQSMEAALSQKKIGDPGGFCAAWSTWYAENRLKYPNAERGKLVEKLIRKIREDNINVNTLIRNYTRKITTLRDKFLKEVGMDINDWKNENYQPEQLDKFIRLIQEV